VRIVVLGDRDPKYLTHRELDAALALFPDGRQDSGRVHNGRGTTWRFLCAPASTWTRLNG
jgi:hypothetical protein